jgi:hypothetical protein
LAVDTNGGIAVGAAETVSGARSGELSWGAQTLVFEAASSNVTLFLHWNKSGTHTCGPNNFTVAYFDLVTVNPL